MAAGGEPLGVARRRAGLADLVHVREEGKHGLLLARAFRLLVRQRLAAAERCSAEAQEREDQLSGLGDVNLPVGLLLGPARPGDKQQPRVRADRLRVPHRRAQAFDRSAYGRQSDHDHLNLRGGCFTRKGRMSPRVQQQEPRARLAADGRLHALAIEPARRIHAVVAGKRCNVRIEKSAQPMRHSGGNAHKSRAARGQNNAGLRRAAQRLASRGVCRVARLREALTRNREQTRSGCRNSASRNRRRFRGSGAKNADGQLRRVLLRQLHARAHRLQRSLRQCRASFIHMRQYQNRLHCAHSAPIHSTSSRAISSAVMFFSMRVSRCCLGRLTET